MTFEDCYRRYPRSFIAACTADIGRLRAEVRCADGPAPAIHAR